MPKKNFIIFGNTGFVGKNLEAYIKLKYKKNFVFGFGSKKIDLTKKKDALKLKKYINSNSIIFFLSFNKKQLNSSIFDFEKNYLMIKNFFELIKIRKPKKIIFFSTQSIYGEDTHNLKTTEKTIPDPVSYYGIAKYTAERLLLKIANEEKLSLIIVRTPRIYGPGDSPKNYGPTKFTHHFVKNIPLIIWGDGEEKRDYIHIDDVVKILDKLIKLDFKGEVNICTGKPYSFKQLIQIIKKLVKREIIIKQKNRTRSKVDQIMKNSFLIKTIGNYRFKKIEKGIKEMVDHVK